MCEVMYRNSYLLTLYVMTCQLVEILNASISLGRRKSFKGFCSHCYQIFRDEWCLFPSRCSQVCGTCLPYFSCLVFWYVSSPILLFFTLASNVTFILVTILLNMTPLSYSFKKPMIPSSWFINFLFYLQLGHSSNFIYMIYFSRFIETQSSSRKNWGICFIGFFKCYFYKLEWQITIYAFFIWMNKINCLIGVIIKKVLLDK